MGRRGWRSLCPTPERKVPVAADAPLFLPVELAGRTFQRLNLDHPEPLARVWEEVEAGVPVYYDRVWGLTDRFSAWLLENPSLVEGKNALVVGAGVGMETVVVGSLARTLDLNDMAPVSLELLQRQLEENGIAPRHVHAGSFAEVPLAADLDVVVACFVIYDRGSAVAMERLLERSGEQDVPVLLAGEDIGGHFSRLLGRTSRTVTELRHDDEAWVVRVG